MAQDNRRLSPINVPEVLRLQRVHGLSDEALAQKAGITTGTLSNWLNGKVRGAFKNKVKKLAVALEVSPEQITKGEPNHTVVEPPRPTTFAFSLRCTGIMKDGAAGRAKLQEIQKQLVGVLMADNNISLDSYEGSISTADRTDRLTAIYVLCANPQSSDEQKRVLALIVAVKIALVETLKYAFAVGTLDLFSNLASDDEVRTNGEIVFGKILLCVVGTLNEPEETIDWAHSDDHRGCMPSGIDWGRDHDGSFGVIPADLVIGRVLAIDYNWLSTDANRI